MCPIHSVIDDKAVSLPNLDYGVLLGYKFGEQEFFFLFHVRVERMHSLDSLKNNLKSTNAEAKAAVACNHLISCLFFWDL